MTRDPHRRGRVAAAGARAATSLIRSVNWTARAGCGLRTAAFSRTVQAARGSHRLVRGFGPWGIVLTLISVTIALITIMVDLEDRQAERTFRAWQIVLAERSVGSSQREALEYLNRTFDGSVCGSWVNWVSKGLTGNSRRECIIPRKERGSLAELAATNAGLPGAELPGADLYRAELALADLTRANLLDANLAFADFSRANLLDANLAFADLSRAELTSANLQDANLAGADLTGAELQDANLSGANLRDASVTQTQLDAACGFLPPVNIPTELTWRSGRCSWLDSMPWWVWPRRARQPSENP